MTLEPNCIQPFLDQVIKDCEPLTIDIDDENGSVLGCMRPVTILHLSQEDVICKLTEWRSKNMGAFLTQFNATPERTRNWLEKVVFKKTGMMLFLIYWNDCIIGHLGFKELTTTSAMLDNAIKGERLGPPKLFVYAHRCLVKWLLDRAGIKTFFGIVFADNAPALMMNREIGWTGWVKLPLIKEQVNGEARWKMGKENESSPTGKYCYKIFMEKDKK